MKIKKSKQNQEIFGIINESEALHSDLLFLYRVKTNPEKKKKEFEYKVVRK